MKANQKHGFKQTTLDFGQRQRKRPRLSPEREQDSLADKEEPKPLRPKSLQEQPKGKQVAEMEEPDEKAQEEAAPSSAGGSEPPPDEKPSNEFPQALPNSLQPLGVLQPITKMSSQGTFRITDKVGDLFDAPPNSVLIHACNCIGSWSGGIARAFRDHYPDAYRIYNAHCKRSLPERLAGTALLIAPRPDAGKQHYIGCVFTSKRFGRAKDTPAMILRSTAPAMLDLMRQVAAEMENGEEIGEIRMCRINSGLFSVPWQQSKRVIERLQLGEEDVPKDVELPWEIVTYNPE